VRSTHDLFDAGLWTVDDNLRIRVAKSDIAESIIPGGSHFKLADLDGRPLFFAPQAKLRPDPPTSPGTAARPSSHSRSQKESGCYLVV
jgi:hypothetical protein